MSFPKFQVKSAPIAKAANLAKADNESANFRNFRDFRNKPIPEQKNPSTPCPTCGSLQDIPEVPRSGTPQPVEAWTPSGTCLLVPAYSEEHAAAIRRMNPPPTGDRQRNLLSTEESKETGMKLDAADRQEAYEERCAIMQYDGGLTMREAEQKAGTCYYCRRWRGTRSGKGYCVPNGLTPPVRRMANETCEQFTMDSPDRREYAPDTDDSNSEVLNA